MTLSVSSPTKPLRHMVWAFGSALLAGAVGSLATVPNIPTWYAGLHKPEFTPPNWVFGPAWTALYILMAIALLRILAVPRGVAGRRPAIIAYSVQLGINAFWSVTFFGLHSPVFGLILITLLLVAITVTCVTFWHVEKISAMLLLPYLFWVCFASALNAGIVLLNR